MQDEKPTADPADDMTETPALPVAETTTAEPAAGSPAAEPAAEVAAPAAVELAAAIIEQATEVEDAPIETTAEAQPADAEPAAAAEEPPPADETEPAAPEPEPKPRPNDRPARPARNDAQQREAERVMRRFHACGRCSTLVSACGVAFGRDNVRDAAAATRDGWLTLDCDRDVLRLLDNAYSISLDMLSYYLDGSCPECRRRFIFSDRTDEEKGCQLRLSL